MSVLRSMTSNATSHKIVVDNEEIFLIAPWVYTSFHLAQGGHRVGIKSLRHLSNLIEKSAKIPYKLGRLSLCFG
jgi:hypothetical protein